MADYEGDKSFIKSLENLSTFDSETFENGISGNYGSKQLFLALVKYLIHATDSKSKVDPKVVLLAGEKVKSMIYNKTKFCLEHYEVLIKCMESIVANKITQHDSWSEVSVYLSDGFSRTFKYTEDSDIGRDRFFKIFKSLLAMLMNFSKKNSPDNFYENLAYVIYCLADSHKAFAMEACSIMLDTLKVFVFTPSWKKEGLPYNIFYRLLGLEKETIGRYNKQEVPKDIAKYYDQCINKGFDIIFEAIDNPKTCNIEYLDMMNDFLIVEPHKKNALRALKNWDNLFLVFTSIHGTSANTGWTFSNISDALVNIFSSDETVESDSKKIANCIDSMIEYVTKNDKAKTECIDVINRILKNDEKYTVELKSLREKLYESYMVYIEKAAARKQQETTELVTMARELEDRMEDTEFLKMFKPRAVTFLRNLPLELASNEDWGTVLRIFVNPIHEDPILLKKPTKEFIEMTFHILHFPSIEGYFFRIERELKEKNPRVFAPYTKEILANLKNSNIIRMLPDVFKFNPDPFYKSIDNMLEIWEDLESSDKSTLLSFIYTMSKIKPHVVKCFVVSPLFKDALYNQMTCNMTYLVLKEYSNVSVIELLDWIDDLKTFVSTSPMSAYSIAEIFGIIGRSHGDSTDRLLQIMDEMMKEQAFDTTAVMGWIYGMYNIQQEYPHKVSPYVPYIRQVLKKAMDQNVRNVAQMVIDVEEKKDLKSVNQRVDVVEVKVEQVVEQVNVQNSKIEKIDVKVEENTTIVKQVKEDMTETKQKVEEVNNRVDIVEVKVEQQDIKIQKILDQFDEMNAKVSESCKNFDEIKEYVDKNIGMVKDFVAQVVKKLPNPYKFTSQGKIRRKLVLYFECSKSFKGCLHNRDDPFTTITSDWAKWLKIGFSLFKLTKCLYDKDIFGTVDTVKDIYNDFKSKEDANFMSYISQPFLTAAEQDSLIEQLRDERFFDLFEYDAQKANWCCTNCVHKEEDEPEIIVEAVVEKNEVNQETATEHAEEIVKVQKGEQVIEDEKKEKEIETEIEVKKETKKKEKKEKKEKEPVEDEPNLPLKLESQMKVSVGLFKSITGVWCVLNDSELTMYAKQTSPKPKHKVNKKDIISIKDIDSRVSKADHSFKIITKNRTYTAIAPDAETLNEWKKSLVTKK